MAEAQEIKKMKKLLDKLFPMLEKLYKRKNDKPPFPFEAYPPALEADIVAAEKLWKFKFPPSYRAFLKIHNGCQAFRHSFCVLGVSGPANEMLLKQWQGAVKSWERRIRRMKNGPQILAQVKKDEKDITKDVLYMPNHVPVVITKKGIDYYVFDRNHPGKRGEYPTVEVQPNSTEGINRCSDFTEIVRETIDWAEHNLEHVVRGDPH